MAASPPHSTTKEGQATRPSVLSPPGGTWQGSNEMNTSRGDPVYREDDESDDDNLSPRNHVNGALVRGSSDGAIVVRSRNGRTGSSRLSPNARVGQPSTGFRRSPTTTEGGSARPTRAECKRHSWAARQQHEVIPEEPSPVLHGGGSGINRALSLDSAITGRNRQPPWTSARTPTSMRNGHASPGGQDDVPHHPYHHPHQYHPQHYQQPPPYDYHEVSSNGEVRQSPGDILPTTPLSPTVLPTYPPLDNTQDDTMDICHDPTSHSDRAKYITDHDKHTGTGCSDCCRSPCCTASECCRPGRPLHNFCTNLFRRGKCSCKQKSDDSELDDDIYIEDDPFRKRCLRAFLNFVYVLLAFIAVIVTYSMIQDLITAMNNPVRSIHYKKLKDYEAPGISMYPGGAKFLACGHYYNNVVTSKVRTSDLDLVNRNCTYTRLNYDDPHYIGVRRDVLVVRGPTSFEKREAIFLHFELEDETRDFFTVSYFVFPGWDKFNASTVPEQIDQLTEYHRYMPTFALSSGLRMWIKLIMSETYLMDDTKHTEFRVEYSVVKFWDRRPENVRKKHLFFIFFEWKNNIVEQSYLIYTTTPWSIGAGLCGVFLTLHRGYQLAQIGYKRARKDKERRSIRKRTIRELKKAKSMERQDGKAKVNRKLKQQLST